MKLIKLSETHYIVVDDSEMKEGSDYWYLNGDSWHQASYRKGYYDRYFPFGKQITHSFGVKLEGIINKPLSEVEELIYGYSVEKMAENYYKTLGCLGDEYDKVTSINLIKWGFNAHKELVKDKLFTVEDIFNYSQMICKKIPKLKKLQTSQADDYGNNLGVILKIQDEFIQSLLPPTEWKVKEVTPEGKIVLL